jgi:hypothetical protein
MSGYSTYTRWQRIEAQAKLLGFRIGNPKHGHWGGGSQDGVDQVTLYPDGEALPVYTRDAELFTGTFRDVEIFLGGWTRAQSYDMILRMTDEKRRRKFEDAELARQAEMKKREEQKQVLAVLKSTDQANRSKKSK